ncbi:MAG: hypothetical protein ACI9VS_003535 [Candidatus Binatia bacterium]|jgi:hypothetical protein
MKYFGFAGSWVDPIWEKVIAEGWDTKDGVRLRC